MTVEHLNRSIATSELTSAMKPRPGPGAPPAAAAAPETLEAKIQARKQQLISKLVELEADTQEGAAEARDKLEARLSELAHIVKGGVVDGWANINAMTAGKLDSWLAK